MSSPFGLIKPRWIVVTVVAASILGGGCTQTLRPTTYRPASAWVDDQKHLKTTSPFVVVDATRGEPVIVEENPAARFIEEDPRKYNTYVVDGPAELCDFMELAFAPMLWVGVLVSADHPIDRLHGCLLPAWVLPGILAPIKTRDQNRSEFSASSATPDQRKAIDDFYKNVRFGTTPSSMVGPSSSNPYRWQIKDPTAERLAISYFYHTSGGRTVKAGVYPQEMKIALEPRQSSRDVASVDQFLALRDRLAVGSSQDDIVGVLGWNFSCRVWVSKEENNARIWWEPHVVMDYGSSWDDRLLVVLETNGRLLGFQEPGRSDLYRPQKKTTPPISEERPFLYLGNGASQPFVVETQPTQSARSKRDLSGLLEQHFEFAWQAFEKEQQQQEDERQRREEIARASQLERASPAGSLSGVGTSGTSGTSPISAMAGEVLPPESVQSSGRNDCGLSWSGGVALIGSSKSLRTTVLLTGRDCVDRYRSNALTVRAQPSEYWLRPVDNKYSVHVDGAMASFDFTAEPSLENRSCEIVFALFDGDTELSRVSVKAVQWPTDKLLLPKEARQRDSSGPSVGTGITRSDAGGSSTASTGRPAQGGAAVKPQGGSSGPVVGSGGTKAVYPVNYSDLGSCPADKKEQIRQLYASAKQSRDNAALMGNNGVGPGRYEGQSGYQIQMAEAYEKAAQAIKEKCW